MSNTHMPLGILCREAGIDCPESSKNIEIFGVTSDSRRVSEGWLFVAIKGLHQDGSQFIPQAIARGAAAVLVFPQTDVPPEAAYIPHPNPREALALLCDAWYGHPTQHMCLVGVTGTNGKTSVSAMLAHILTWAHVPVAVIGTVGVSDFEGQPLSIRSQDETANMTTPDPEELYKILAALRDQIGECVYETPTVIMEVTSHALLLDKLAPLSFDGAVFTNLTPEHLDMHGTMEDYYRAKLRLFRKSRLAVINADDPYGRRLLTETDTSVETWHLCHMAPLTKSADVPHPGIHCDRIYAGQVKLLGSGGVEYRLMSPQARVRIFCPIPGEFTVANSMEAAVMALLLGIPPGRIKEALSSFPGVPGRMERVSLGEHVGFSVFLDYAHTPDALENLLITAKRFRRKGERMVLLFGCGGDRDPSKRPLMAAVASRLADAVIVTSDNSRTEDPMAIIEDILKGMDEDCDYVVIPDRRDAIRYVIRQAKRGDIILLAGKGHETYEIDKNGRHAFSEKALVKEAADIYHPQNHG